MDKQTDNPISAQMCQFPVNTRTIGTPEGIYILYLEDYVHTFMKKLLSAQKGIRLPSKEEDDSKMIETGPQPVIALYGKMVEDSGRYRLVVSGAASVDRSRDKIHQIGERYFPESACVGTACLSCNKNGGLRMELSLNNTRVVLDDFYIYYDQNEQMQNYLIEWNEKKVSIDQQAEAVQPGGPRRRTGTEDAARIGRLIQAYGREEAKVSFMWNVMNALCLGFVVCVMAYGIISINNYSKMQNMQASIDYCLALLEEKTSQGMEKVSDMAQAVTTMNQNTEDAARTQQMQVPDDTALSQENPASVTSAPSDTVETVVLDQTDTTAPESAGLVQKELSDVKESTPAQEEALAVLESTPAQENPAPVQQDTADAGAAQENQNDLQSAVQPPAATVPEQALHVPQYYVVRQGDTLRTISLAVYGNYDHVEEICQWNNIDDPNNILYGQKLLLP